MRWKLPIPTYLILCGLILPIHSWLNANSSHHNSASRRLVIILDGVPYETIAELKAGGRFRRFKVPARVISTFPSLTNPAMVEILHHEDAPGYEDHYFDRERNRFLGTIQDRFRGEKFIAGTFRETFDYHASAVNGAVGYLAAPIGTAAMAQLDLVELRTAFRKSNAPLFVGYIGETDSLAHLGGKEQLKSFLRTIDRTVDELIADAERDGGKLEVEMLSDHGNRYDKYKHVKLNDALKQAGFVIEKSINTERSVVLPKHGLVGSSMLFTQVGNRARVAEAGAAAEGVDFAVYQPAETNGNSIELISRRGRARVLRDGDRYKYEALNGDPLRLAAIIETMKQRGAMDAGCYASAEDWWQATRDHLYADPLRRLFDGFGKHVKNRADVIVSYEDGYLLGSPLLSFFASMRATHGNLLRGETEAFAMSTRQELTGSLRGHELNRLFGLDQRMKAEAYFSNSGHCQLGAALAQNWLSTDASKKILPR